jgi:protein SERAC1
VNPDFNSIYRSTYGIVFFGTPHRGGNYVSVGEFAANISKAALQKPSKALLEMLKNNSQNLNELTNLFRHQLNNYRIVSFYEKRPPISVLDVGPLDSSTNTKLI